MPARPTLLLPMRFLAALTALLAIFLVWETPAAAHFGAPHADMPPVAVSANGVDHDAASATDAFLRAADTCNEQCACCTGNMMHTQCHPPAVLAGKASSQPLLAASKAAWASLLTAAAALADGTPPVPPPNAA